MIDADSAFVASDCVRCGTTVLKGRCEGLSWRLDSLLIRQEHARVLKQYGIQIIALTRRACGVWGSVWQPGDTLTPDHVLAVPHQCGSAHARGEQFS